MRIKFVIIIVLSIFINLQNYAQIEINNDITDYLGNNVIEDFVILKNEIWFSDVFNNYFLKYNGLKFTKYYFNENSNGNINKYINYNHESNFPVYKKFVHQKYFEDNVIICYVLGSLTLMFIENDSIWCKDYSNTIDFNSSVINFIQDNEGIIYAYNYLFHGDELTDKFLILPERQLKTKIFKLTEPIEEINIPVESIKDTNVLKPTLRSFLRYKGLYYFVVTYVSEYKIGKEKNILIIKDSLNNISVINLNIEAVNYKYFVYKDLIYLMNNEGKLFIIKDKEILNEVELKIKDRKEWCFWFTVDNKYIYVSNETGLYAFSKNNYYLESKYTDLHFCLENIVAYKNKIYGNLGANDPGKCGGLVNGFKIVKFW